MSGADVSADVTSASFGGHRGRIARAIKRRGCVCGDFVGQG